MPWADDHTLVLPHTSFEVTYGGPSGETLQSTPAKFVLCKTRRMVDCYEELSKRREAKNIFEIGIFKGGSMALFYELLAPEKIVSVDLERNPNAALAAFITENRLAKVLKPYYGVDQSDENALRNIIGLEFPEQNIDLAVDDGCHFLDETRRAFNAIFPFLVSGGYYVIEDWGWAHWPGFWQEGGGPWKDRPAMSVFIFELIMLAASRPDIIEKIEVLYEMVIVTKGTAHIRPGEFDISKQYLFRERVLAEANQEQASAILRESEREQQINTLQAELAMIRGSRSWRLVLILGRVRLAVAPRGSLRERILRWGLHHTLLRRT